MTPDEIISEHNENFALTPSDIVKVEMKKGKGKGGAIINIKVGVNIGGSGDIDDLETPHELIITVKTGKMFFTFNTNILKVKGAISHTFKFNNYFL